MRDFLGIDFLTEQVPDATTLLHFRRLVEENKIGEKIFDSVKDKLDSAGLIMRGGSIIDATIIAAPSSTKNKEGKRDPEMCHTKKGNQWYFGMKIHSGADAGSGYIHKITATPANIHDIEETAKLIREDDGVIYGDSAYAGAGKREEFKNDGHLSSIEFRVSARPSKTKTPKNYQGIQWDRQIENRKSSTRCKVEHPFLIVKRQFGYRKAAYRGIRKNLNRFHILFSSANLVMCLRAGRAQVFMMGSLRPIFGERGRKRPGTGQYNGILAKKLSNPAAGKLFLIKKLETPLLWLN
jgi:IS5 family transposase